jgi:hypothetical protein
VRLLAAALVLFCALPVSAAEVGDVFPASSGGAATSLQIPSVVVPNLPNVTLGVCVGTERSSNSPAAVTAATRAGQDFVSAAAVNMNASSRTQRSELFYLQAPAPGTANVTLALPAGVTAARMHAFAFVLTDVAQAAPEATSVATVSGGVVSVNPATVTENAVLVDCLNLGLSANATATGAGHTRLGNLQDSEQSTFFGTVLASNVGTYPMGWSWGTGTRAAQVAAVFAKAPPAFDPNVDYMPPISQTGLIDVTTDPHCPGVVNNGMTDVTAALQACISYYANGNKLGGTNSPESEDTLCFPDGEYLVSGSLEGIAPAGVVGTRERAYLGLRGCGSPLGATIRLAANSPGFGDPLNPKTLLRFGNPGVLFDPNATDQCCTGSAARNGLRNLRFVVEAGNPGAVVIDYMHNNAVPTVQDIAITCAPDSCAFGLRLSQKWPGPTLFERIQIDGGATGFQGGYPYGNLMFENMLLTNQRVHGINVYLAPVLFKNLVSIQTVPGVDAIFEQGQHEKAGPLVQVLGGNFSGSGSAAINLAMVAGGTAQYRPQIFLRDVVTSGYTNALNNVGTLTATLPFEYASRPVSSLFPSIQASLNLSIPDHAHMIHPNPADWASIVDFGAVPNDGLDDTTAIQAAIDSGKKAIACPAGIFTVSDTIHLRGTFERLVGFDCFFRALGTSMRTPAFKPAFIADDTLTHAVEIENIRLDRGDRNASPFPEPRFVHKSRFAVVLTDVLHVTSYTSEPGAGPLDAKGTCCDQIRGQGGNDLVLRMVNVEDGPTANSGDPTGSPDIECVGPAKCISLGFKNEGNFGIYLSAHDGATFESFGSFFFQDLNGGTATGPIFECIESLCSHSYIGYSGAKWNPQARVVRNGLTALLAATAPGGVSRATFNVLFVERPLP